MNQSKPLEGTPIHELGQVILATESYVFHGDKVLMHRRSPNKARFPGVLIGPGGRIDGGEDVILGAAREIKEETGVTVPTGVINLKAVAIHSHLDRGEVWVNFIIRATMDTNPEDLEHSGDDTSEWMPLAELEEAENVFPASRIYFDHVLRDEPGIMYTNAEFREGKLVRVLSQTVV